MNKKQFILLFAALFLSGCAGVKVKQQVLPSPWSPDFHPPMPDSSGRVRLVFGGDINLGRRVGTLLDEKGKKWAFEACKPILDDADLVAVNLESPVGEGGEPFVKKSVYLKARTDLADVLAYAGISLVTLANNHILDYGPKVADQTTKALDQRGILHTGLVPPGEAVYVPVQDMTLAFLGYCSVCPAGFEAREGRAGVEVALPKIMAREIRKARTKADFVIVMVHWGQEYYGANALQRKLAKDLQEAGADLVIGSHPHVLQKTELLGRTLVAYSLGDMLFDLGYQVCQDSCLLRVDLQKGKKPSWKVFPLNLTSGRPEPLAPESHQARRIQRILSKGYDYHGRKRYPSTQPQGDPKDP